MPDRLQEIRARLDACDTPYIMWRNTDVLYTRTDYDFISHAPADIAWLLNEVERLRFEVMRRANVRDKYPAQVVTVVVDDA